MVAETGTAVCRPIPRDGCWYARPAGWAGAGKGPGDDRTVAADS
jgi:hypothetical protein